jgi:GNAT superfamily N-acetyltransferase
MPTASIEDELMPTPIAATAPLARAEGTHVVQRTSTYSAVGDLEHNTVTRTRPRPLSDPDGRRSRCCALGGLATMTVVRARTQSDCAAFARLATQLGYPCDVVEVRTRLAGLCTDRERAVLVAELDGAVAGWVEVRASQVLFQDGSAEIVGLVVEEALRGRGIGAALVGAAETWAASRGYSRIRVRSNVVRTGTHEFYERLGYVRAKTQLVFERGVAER